MSKAITWVVSEGNDPEIFGNGELGVQIDDQVFMYYKWPICTPCEPINGVAIKVRPAHKREFGEVIKSPFV